MQFKPSINRFTLLGSAIAGIVGSGWLLGPLVCAKIAGPASILCWLIAGILMMVVATTFVLLARAMPVTGGTVRYIQMSYGHFAGFGFSWIAWLAWIAVSPIETMALIQYASNYVPGLMTTSASPVLTHIGIVAGILVMGSIAFVNNYGIKIYSKINHVILALKLSIPLMTAGILLTHSFSASNFSSAQGFMPYGIQSIFAALPMAGVIYAFIGFNPAVQLAAESKNPKRDIPFAVYGALLVCTILYVVVQMAFIGALPSSSLSHGFDQLNFAGIHGPFVGLLTIAGCFWFVKALYADALISPYGTAMVQAVATGRMTHAMSTNGYFPKFLQSLNANGSPKTAILLNTLLGFIFFLPFPSWQHMVGFLVSCLILGYVVGPVSLAIFAKKNRYIFTQLPTYAIHFINILAFYICNLMIYWSGWQTMEKILVMFLVGYGILFAQTCFSKSLRNQLNVLKGIWVPIYMSGLGFISYFGSFGGTKFFTFGEDFLIVAIYSAMIYVFAYYMGIRQSQPNLSLQKTSDVLLACNAL